MPKKTSTREVDILVEPDDESEPSAFQFTAAGPAGEAPESGYKHFPDCKGRQGGACDICWLTDFITEIGIDQVLVPEPGDGIFADRCYKVTGRLYGEWICGPDGNDYDEWFEASAVVEVTA